jgi:hypothetical protein
MTQLLSDPPSNWLPSDGGAPPTPAIAIEALVALGVEDDHHQARWAEWLAKGARRDAAMQSRILFIASLMCIGLAAWMSLGF